MKILLYDTETTGLDPRKSFVLSLGAIMYDDQTGETDEFYRMLNWNELEVGDFSQHISEDAFRVNGISNEMLKHNGISPIQVFSEFYDFLVSNLKSNDIKKSLNVCTAWNAPFDHNMLKSNLMFLQQYNRDFKTDGYNAYKVSELADAFTKSYRSSNNDNKILFIDSMLIDRIYHDTDASGNKLRHSLQAVGERYGIKEDENAHNAIADTRRLLEIWKILQKEMQDSNVTIDDALEDACILEYKNQQQKYAKAYKGKGDYHFSQPNDYFALYMGALNIL